MHAATPPLPPSPKKMDPWAVLLWFLGGTTLLALLLMGVVLVEVYWVSRAEAWPPPSTSWVANPVPIHGQLVPFTLRDTRGAASGTRQLRGGMYLLQVLTTPEDARATERLERLASLQAQLAARGVPIRLVAVATTVPSTPGPLFREETPHRVLLSGDVRPLLERIHTLARPRPESALLPTLLVDQAGGVRGFYELTPSAQDAQRLLDDAQCVSECGPIPALATVSERASVEANGCRPQDLP